jgi:hypothetical protein
MEATKTKPKPSHADLHDRIATVERRLEHRRARLLDDVRESTDAASTAATKAIPIAAALGAGLVAMYVMRQRTPKARLERYYDELDEARNVNQRRGVRWASLAGIVGTLFRIATHPQVRAVLQQFVERRRGRAQGI